MQLISAFPVVCGNVDNKILVRGIAKITKRTAPTHRTNLLRRHHLLRSPNFGKSPKPFLVYRMKSPTCPPYCTSVQLPSLHRAMMAQEDCLAVLHVPTELQEDHPDDLD
jgi:hypothetical protein